jgi:nitrogen fixation protein NifU and related proteins
MPLVLSGFSRGRRLMPSQRRKCRIELRCVFVIVRSMSSFESKVQEALANPKNQGEIPDADAVGTVGSPECGDMLRMWLKFTEKDGRRVIDRASFQAFGCQTAIAVASMATELLKGKTAEEAKHLSARELAGDLGALPPMKIHCGQLVEGALRNALDNSAVTEPSSAMAPTLASDLNRQPAGKIRIVPLD